MLKHIALSITERDLNDFYIDILGGRLIGNSILRQKDASQIFDINKQVDVYYLELDNIELELFINPVLSDTSFNHTCLEIDSADKIFMHAFDKNYWTHLRNSSERETYFIKDKNGNMFELKNKINGHG